MLSADNIRKINNQIANEMRTVQRPFTSDEEKAAALDRIAKLKELLEPTQATESLPSRKTILKELAAAIIEAREDARLRNEPTTLFEALFGPTRR
jgi:hypothetical protein